jgi:hypothetical protein
MLNTRASGAVSRHNLIRLDCATRSDCPPNYVLARILSGEITQRNAQESSICRSVAPFEAKYLLANIGVSGEARSLRVLSANYEFLSNLANYALLPNALRHVNSPSILLKSHRL